MAAKNHRRWRHDSLLEGNVCLSLSFKANEVNRLGMSDFASTNCAHSILGVVGLNPSNEMFDGSKESSNPKAWIFS